MNYNEILKKIETIEKELQELKSLIKQNDISDIEPIQDKPVIAPVKIEYNKNEFEIDGTTLIEYMGKSETIKIPDGVTKIGNNAFNGSFVKEVILPDSVKEIGICAFRMSRLSKINLPKNLMVIREGAFSFCRTLVNVDVPYAIKEIEDYAFGGCENLKISIPSQCRYAANSFFGCANVTYI